MSLFCSGFNVLLLEFYYFFYALCGLTPTTRDWVLCVGMTSIYYFAVCFLIAFGGSFSITTMSSSYSLTDCRDVVLFLNAVMAYFSILSF